MIIRRHHRFLMAKTEVCLPPKSFNASKVARKQVVQPWVLRLSTHTCGHFLETAGVGATTDSRQLLDSRVHSSLVVAYSRVCRTQVGRTLEYVPPGLYSTVCLSRGGL